MSNKTIIDFLDEYNESFIKGLKSYRTYVKYRSVIQNQIKSFFGDLSINDLSKELILEYYGHIKLHYSSHTLNTNSVILKAGLNLLKQEGVIKENYALFIPREKPKPKAIPNLKKKEIERLLELFNEDKLYGCFFSFIYYTGTRRGEALAIVPSDIDFEKKTIRISKQITLRTRNGGSEITNHTKTKKDRFISMDDSLHKLIERQIKQNNRYKEKHSTYEDSGLLFQSKRGQCICNSELMEHFKNIVSSIGHPELTLHDLRKLRAIHLTETKSLETARKELGHSRGTTTINFYSTVTTSQMIVLANHIDEVFGKYLEEKP